MDVTNPLKYVINHERKAKQSLHITKNHFDAQTKLLESIHNKPANICGYLISHVKPETNLYSFSIIHLAQKFDCSKSTVRRALTLLRKDPYLIVDENTISYNLPKSKKVGDNSGN